MEIGSTAPPKKQPRRKPQPNLTSSPEEGPMPSKITLSPKISYAVGRLLQTVTMPYAEQISEALKQPREGEPAFWERMEKGFNRWTSFMEDLQVADETQLVADGDINLPLDPKDLNRRNRLGWHVEFNAPTDPTTRQKRLSQIRAGVVKLREKDMLGYPNVQPLNTALQHEFRNRFSIVVGYAELLSGTNAHELAERENQTFTSAERIVLNAKKLHDALLPLFKESEGLDIRIDKNGKGSFSTAISS